MTKSQDAASNPTNGHRGGAGSGKLEQITGRSPGK